jgi:outer membrane lipoprotein SlyB
MRNYLKLIAMSSALAVVAAPIAAEARPAKRVVKVCRKSSGTAGLIAGGAGGALLGHAALGGPVGMVAGAVGGAFAGRAIDRTITAKKRCRYVEARR